jgi:hypothetical protein
MMNESGFYVVATAFEGDRKFIWGFRILFAGPPLGTVPVDELIRSYIENAGVFALPPSGARRAIFGPDKRRSTASSRDAGHILEGSREIRFSRP